MTKEMISFFAGYIISGALSILLMGLLQMRYLNKAFGDLIDSCEKLKQTLLSRIENGYGDDNSEDNK